jgi:hypothetical protein
MRFRIRIQSHERTELSVGLVIARLSTSLNSHLNGGTWAPSPLTGRVGEG